MSNHANRPFLGVGRRARLAAGAALLSITACFAAANAAAQESISFPARAADLKPDTYWTVNEFSEGCCTSTCGAGTDRNGSAAAAVRRARTMTGTSRSTRPPTA